METVLAELVLVLLLAYIWQNITQVAILFFVPQGLSVTVVMPLSAVCGALMVAIPAVTRIQRLRRA